MVNINANARRFGTLHYFIRFHSQSVLVSKVQRHHSNGTSFYTFAVRHLRGVPHYGVRELLSPLYFWHMVGLFLCVSMPPFCRITFRAGRLLGFAFLPLLGVGNLRETRSFQTGCGLFAISFARFSRLRPFQLFSHRLRDERPLRLPVSRNVCGDHLLYLPVVRSYYYVTGSRQRLPLGYGGSVASAFSFRLTQGWEPSLYAPGSNGGRALFVFLSRGFGVRDLVRVCSPYPLLCVTTYKVKQGGPMNFQPANYSSICVRLLAICVVTPVHLQYGAFFLRCGPFSPVG